MTVMNRWSVIISVAMVCGFVLTRCSFAMN